LFALAAEPGVSQACRLMGVHRSTYYRWKAQVEHSGLEMLRPRERRGPVMPNQLSGYRAPFAPPREPLSEAHIDTSRPGELVGIDCFFVGRLHGAQCPVWQITAIDTYSGYAWAELVTTGPKGPNSAQTSALAHRIAAELQQAGWQLERVLTDNGTGFGRREFAALRPRGHVTARSAPGARRPTATSNPCTARSSKSAGDRRSRATSKSA
jgi:hypothetical protein